MKTNKPELYNSNIIDEMFGEISQEDFEKTTRKMKLAAKIADAIKSKGWKKSEFAKIVKQQPSVISKWLSGTHNFTTDTLIDLEHILNIKLLNADQKSESVTYKRSVETTVEIDEVTFWNKNLINSFSRSPVQFSFSGNLLHQENTKPLPC
jgi:transcriptional regulator with XRE-family HTH domain